MSGPGRASSMCRAHTCVPWIPDSAVVTGVRGAGKTFWWETLADPLMLKALDSFFPSYRLATYEVLQAFGPRTSEHWPSRLVFDRLAGHDAEIIWRAVLLRRLGLLEADDWVSACAWVNGHVEEAERRLLAHDRQRAEQDRPALVVFDGLDQVASLWVDIYALLRACCASSPICGCFAACGRRRFFAMTW
ncbi:MAG: hypothetical protein R3F43_30180 [bacterium]